MKLKEKMSIDYSSDFGLDGETLDNVKTDYQAGWDAALIWASENAQILEEPHWSGEGNTTSVDEDSILNGKDIEA